MKSEFLSVLRTSYNSSNHLKFRSLFHAHVSCFGLDYDLPRKSQPQEVSFQHATFGGLRQVGVDAQQTLRHKPLSVHGQCGLVVDAPSAQISGPLIKYGRYSYYL